MKSSSTEVFETMAPEELRRSQLAAASLQLRYAAANSPYYREVVGQASGIVDATSVAEFAQQISPITKDLFISRQRAEPPYGGWLAVDEDELVRHYVYATGQVLAWSASDLATHLDQYAAGLRVGGITRSDRVDITFQYAWVAAGTIWDAAAQHLGAAVVPGGAGESARHAANMKLLRTTALIGFATFLQRIGEAAGEQGIDPARDLAVQKLIIVGEWHGSDAKQTLSSLFGDASVREAYGTAETGLVAVECKMDPTGMHVHPDFLIEVRDPVSREEVAPGGGGELYITPLRSRAMPVLRYQTGDVAEFVRFDVCGCGRSTPRIGRIVGRVGDYLRVKGVFLNRSMIEAVLKEVSEAYGAFHMDVDRPEGLDRLHLTVEGPPELTDDTKQIVVRKMKERGSVAVAVSHVPPGSISTEGSWFTDRRK